MPLIWAAISGHGFGHAAQVVPVLNAFHRLVPDLRVLLRTTVSPSFFKDRLVPPWDLSPIQQDVGCIQNGPLKIDIEATWQEHHRFHSSWEERLHMEIEAMRVAGPNVVLADTSYLAVAAGKAAAIPSVALVSLTWDLVLSDYVAPPSIDNQEILKSIRQAYGQADLALRISPAPKMEVFQRVIDIGPIAEPAPSAREHLTKYLKLAPGEQTVLVGFGGVPLDSLPFDRLESLTAYRFLFDGSVPPESKRWISIKSFPFSFKALMASVDVIMTKPGYGTSVEAVALQTPMVYVRRYNFADEQPLVDFLHRYGKGAELSMTDFVQGNWLPTFQQVAGLAVSSSPPPLTGAQDAATILAAYF